MEHHPIYHENYGFLHPTGSYWATDDGRRYGTFLDFSGTIVNLLLSEVIVL